MKTTHDTKPPGRGAVRASAFFACLECWDGEYHPGARPTCSACGAEAPRSVREVIHAIAPARAA